MSLSATVKSIQDIMRKDVGVDGDAQRIGQLVWLFFLKIWDDREQELELIEDGFQSPLVNVRWTDGTEEQVADDLRWRAWAADPEGMTGNGLLEFLNDTLFPALKNLDPGPRVEVRDDKSRSADALHRRKALVRSVFDDAYQYMKSGTLVRQVVNKVESGIDFNDSKSRHLFGDVYEQVLQGLQGAGNAGEYYTPRALTQFAVDMIDPKLGEKIFDPACGTGGFLTCTIEHIRSNEVKTAEQEQELHRCIHGVEKKPLPHLLCTTNMIVHGIDVPTGVRHDNTLSRPLRDITAKDRVDVVVTNPPFGGMEEDGIENNFPTEFRTRETADLFLVLIMELLKPGGRAAVVLPDGTLFGEGVKTRIKERLLSECNLHTIVRLPKGVFSPYTSINTNVLFFEKGRPTEEVWYYEHPYPEGYKSYSKTKPMRIEEFEPEKDWWTDRQETERAWRVDLAQIRERAFNLDIKNANAPEDTHEDPDLLLARFSEQRKAADAIREELRTVLTAALEARA
jgi:type I restriction enzyme M protein